MSNEEVRQNINSRRDKIFLLMEELRRLRIQQRLKVCGCVWGVLLVPVLLLLLPCRSGWSCGSSSGGDGGGGAGC